MSSVLQQAQAEKLTLLAADNKAGYFGVHLAKPGQPKPYRAWVWRDGKTVFLGTFATAEEAALCVARTPEGRAVAGRAAAAEGQGTLPAVPSGARLKQEGVVPPMLPGTFAKDEVVVKENKRGSDGRAKRQRGRSDIRYKRS